MPKKAANSQLTLTSVTQKLGADYEAMAQQFLQQQGLIFLYQNWLQPKVGEIDLVMIEKGKAWDILVFVEVRARKINAYGTATNSITKSKQRKLTKTAQYFLQAHPQYYEYECRFDVVTYDIENPTANSEENKQQVNTTTQAKAMSGMSNAEVSNKSTRDSQPEWLQGAFYASP